MLKHTVVLTIAGSDSGGGAGIQADLKTFSALGVYGASVIAAVTAQNLEGVSAIQAISPAVVEAQLAQVLSGFPVRAAKTGMLFSAEIIGAVATILARQQPQLPLVVDPVFVATSGSRLIEDDAIRLLQEKLFPLATLLTPNLPEAEYLLGESIAHANDLPRAGERLARRYGVSVLMKGGHLPGEAIDVLCCGSSQTVLRAARIEGVNTHGSGCTLSAAIAAFLARGLSLADAVREAKDYLHGAMRLAHPLRRDMRVIDHFWPFSEAKV